MSDEVTIDRISPVGCGAEVNMKSKSSKGGKGRQTAPNQLALNSLSSALPVVIPEASSVFPRSNSAPSTPVTADNATRQGQGRHHRPFLKIFSSRPSSPAKSRSEGTHRKRPFGLKRNKHKKQQVNGEAEDKPSSNSTFYCSSGSSLEPEATPVETLPGQHGGSGTGGANIQRRDSIIPTITVSPSGGEDGELEDAGLTTMAATDGQRKLSESSHHSQTHSITSGVGSLLLPSGDEDGISDNESLLLSPMSGISSIGSEDELQTPGAMVEECCFSSPLPSPSSLSAAVAQQDEGVYTEKDLNVGSPSSEHELGRHTTPPLLSLDAHGGTSGACGSGGGVSGSSATSGGSPKLKRKIQKPWDRVKKVVHVWSPFVLQFSKKKYNWVQLAGHQDTFAPGSVDGAIMKKSDTNESNALKLLLHDSLRHFAPEFKNVVEKDGDMYVEMEDLLREFDEPAVMDIKMGVRTYLEEELVKARTKKVLRKDMYEKMVSVDPNEPTAEEHAQKAITKLHYMQWRESLSSTSNLGFRIEAIKNFGRKALKDFKTTKSEVDVVAALKTFLSENPSVKGQLFQRLLDLRKVLDTSEFFMSHELVGSSLLFVFDSSGRSNINMIDFGKTVELPPGYVINHKVPWVEGSHEDGYLWGLDNLIRIWKAL